jgi:hypothetical protein
MMAKQAPEWTPKEAHLRLLARFVREALAAERFESLADLTAAVKALSAQRRIRFTPDDLSEVYHRLASNGAALVPPPDAFRRTLRAHGGGVSEVSKVEAAAIVVRLWQRLGA